MKKHWKEGNWFMMKVFFGMTFLISHFSGFSQVPVPVVIGNKCSYFIEKDIIIGKTSTWKIDPGCRIFISPGVRITVEGKLIAKGTLKDKITFTCKDSSSYWNNIVFTGQEVPEIEYCVFEKTIKKDNLDGVLHFMAGSKLQGINQCTFRHIKSGAILIASERQLSEIKIENLQIYDAEDFGVSVTRINYLNRIIFNNNKIEGKKYAPSANPDTIIGFTGIRLLGTICDEVNFIKNKISFGKYKYDDVLPLRNHWGGALLIETPVSNIGFISFEQDTFINNSGKNAAATISGKKVLLNKILIQNNLAISGGCSVTSNSIEISSSIFSGNKNIDSNKPADPAGGGGLTIRTISDTAHVKITNSVFQNNTVEFNGGGGIKIFGASQSLDYIDISGCQIKTNTSFFSNGGGILISNFSNINHISLSGNNYARNKVVTKNQPFEGVLGGGGICIMDVDKITNFELMNSDSIREHVTEIGSGGFLSCNRIKEVTSFNYANNYHGGMNEAKAGHGGVVFLDIIKMDDYSFSYNREMYGRAFHSGGIFYCSNGAKLGDISIIRNGIQKGVAKNGSGGGFFISHGSINSIYFQTNTFLVDSAKNSGGALCLLTNKGHKISLDNNTFSNSYAEEMGGVYFIDYTDSFDQFFHKKNKIQSGIAQNGNGGTLAFTFRKGNSVEIAGNKAGTLKSGGAGGGYFIQGDSLKSFFTMDSDTITGSESRKEGGYLYFKGKLSDSDYNYIIQNNVVKGSTISGSSGGFSSIHGKILQSISVNGNKINSSIAETDGGMVFIESGTLLAENLIFSNNEILTESKSKNGKGGILAGEGNVNRILFKDNKNIQSVSSTGPGGGMYWNNTVTNPWLSIISTEISGNRVKIAKSTENHGGFMYLESDSIQSFKLERNYFEECTAKQSGGGFWVTCRTKGINDLQIKEDTLSSKGKAFNGYGGFALFYTPVNLVNLNIEGNLFKNGEFYAFHDGGLFNFDAGTIQKASILKNKLNGTVTAGNGGFASIKGNFPALKDPTAGFTIEGNTVNAKIIAVYDGGFLYYVGQNKQSLQFRDNQFNNVVNVGNRGGILFFNNTFGNSPSISFVNNKFLPIIASDSIKAKYGALIHYEGNFYNTDFSFTGNEVENTKADSAGALIYIKNYEGFQNNIRISSNLRLNNLSAGLTGSVISINGLVTDNFIFENNILKNCKIGITNAPGGAIFINNQKGTLSNLTLRNNTATNFNSSGFAAMLKFEEGNVLKVRIEQNKLTTLDSKRTGAFHFNIGTIGDFLSTGNHFKSVTGQKGALYYWNGSSAAWLKKVHLVQDTLETGYSSSDGGAVFIDLPRVELFEVMKSRIENIRTGGNGGVLCAQENITISETIFSEDSVKNCQAIKDGGIVSINGNIPKFDIKNCNFRDNKADGLGGILKLINMGTSGTAFFAQGNFFNKQDLYSGAGGGFYLRNWKKVVITGSKLAGLRCTRYGGGINAENVDSLQIDRSRFILNESIEKDGGGMSLQTIGLFKSKNNWYNGNLAKKGSGGGISFTDGNISMLKDRVLYNTAHSGAGILFQNADGNIDSSYFEKNYVNLSSNHVPLQNQDGAMNYGGAIKSCAPRDTGLVIKDTGFSINEAYKGGAVFLNKARDRFYRCKFVHNFSEESGAAVYAEDCPDVRYFNCIFYQNEVSETFMYNSNYTPIGGIHIYYTDTTAKTEITNCILNENFGLAVGIEQKTNKLSKSMCRIINSILYKNKYLSEENFQFNPPNKNYGKYPENLINSMSVEYSCVQHINTAEFPTCINSNPLWRFPDNYCLLPQSPCVDKGSSDFSYLDLNGTRNDMGVMGGPHAFRECESSMVELVNQSVTSAQIIPDRKLQPYLYPNPTRGIIYLIPGSLVNGDIKVSVYSPSGKLMKIFNLSGFGAKDRLELDLSALPGGLYFVKITDNLNFHTEKIVVM